MEILIENKKIKDYKRENPHLIILIMRVSIQRPLSHPCKIIDQSRLFCFHPTASNPFAVILTCPCAVTP